MNAPYIHMLGKDHYLWQCRACDWTLEATTNEHVEHRCGFGPCIHKGERCGELRTKCGAYPAFRCSVHGRCVPALTAPQTKSLYTFCMRCTDFASLNEGATDGHRS